MQYADHTVVFGGSFNPPHVAHQQVCEYLLQDLGVKEVWLMPCWVHPFGKNLAPFEHRVAMCELLVRDMGTKVLVSRLEAKLGGSGRTYDLLLDLTRRYPDRNWGLAVGADISQEKHRWYRWDDIESMVDVLCLERQGYVGGDLGCGFPDIASHQIRSRLASGMPIDELVSDVIGEYIIRHSLYAS